jgi:hypothetical protein
MLTNTKYVTTCFTDEGLCPVTYPGYSSRATTITLMELALAIPPRAAPPIHLEYAIKQRANNSERGVTATERRIA